MTVRYSAVGLGLTVRYSLKRRVRPLPSLSKSQKLITFLIVSTVIPAEREGLLGLKSGNLGSVNGGGRRSAKTNRVGAVGNGGQREAKKTKHHPLTDFHKRFSVLFAVEGGQTGQNLISI